MALCNKYVALSSVETANMQESGEEGRGHAPGRPLSAHIRRGGEEGRGHLARPPAVCMHQQSGPVCPVCESLFYLETILKQILSDVQLPSVNISADERWGFE